MLTPDRMYPIAFDEEHGVLAGLLDGKQVLAQLSASDGLVLTFSPEGDLVDVRRDHFTAPNQRDAARRALLDRLQRGVIRVKRFYTNAKGIREYPRVLEEYLAEPASFPGRLGEQTAIDLATWQKGDTFVLDWAGGEYYIDNAGIVIST